MTSTAPDGYSRKMLVINGQYPGPLIEANEGDIIVVNVQNDLPTGNGLRKCLLIPQSALPYKRC